MAVTVGVGNIIMVRPEVQLTTGDSTAFNVLHYEITNVQEGTDTLPPATGEPFYAIAEAMAQYFYGVYGAAWQPAAAVAARLKSVTVQNISPQPLSRAYKYIPDNELPGLDEDDPLPLQDSATVLKQTEFGGRAGLGRAFFAGLTEDAQTFGRLTPAAVLALQPFVDFMEEEHNFVTGTRTYFLRPVLFRPAKTNPPMVERITPIRTAVLSDTLIKTQRRRRPGKGI